MNPDISYAEDLNAPRSYPNSTAAQAPNTAKVIIRELTTSFGGLTPSWDEGLNACRRLTMIENLEK